MEKRAYEYSNIPIPGGGYVTGFLFSENEDNSLYLRTDIGGAYRFDKENKRWVSLIDSVTMKDLRETYPIALALSESGTLYIVSGSRSKERAKLSVSEDSGKSFTYYDLPFFAHGNLNGRGSGYKLIVDREDENLLFYASQTEGLFKSKNKGKDWEKILSLKEDYLTFVGQIPGKNILFVGSAGVSLKSYVKENPYPEENEEKFLRGPALFVSFDKGESFTELKGPESLLFPKVKLSGPVAVRYSYDEKYLYVTYEVNGPNARNHDLGYSSDGSSVWGGEIFRYDYNNNLKGENITPGLKRPIIDEEDFIKETLNGDNPMDSGGTFGEKKRLIDKYGLDILSFGLSGISASGDGILALSSLSREEGDLIFLSKDYGSSWKIILHDLDKGKMDFRTQYMKPEYNGGHNLIHWMSDLKINPLNKNELWFNTGTGPFVTKNLLSEPVHFSDWADGIEETVHINVYSPHEGPVRVIDIVGDLGGFAFEDLTRPKDNSFEDSEGNRYITCLNADYSDKDPKKVIVTARGNWTGKTKGGLIYSFDQCKSFERINLPFGLTKKLDSLFEKIEKPNVNPGWVALSPNGEKIVYSVADGVFLPADSVLVSPDGGLSFEKVNIFDLNKNKISDIELPLGSKLYDKLNLFRGGFLGKLKSGSKEALKEEEGSLRDVYGFKAFSDRVKDEIFYGFSDKGEFYLSLDFGKNFYQKEIEEEGVIKDNIHYVNFALVDTINKADVRCSNGVSSVFFMALQDKGLYKFYFDFKEDRARLIKLSKPGDVFFKLGLGIGKDEESLLSQNKTIYTAAIIDGEYGFYLSTDFGKSFVRINESDQMFGEINSISGDGRNFGEFYLATGSRGILWGRPKLD